MTLERLSASGWSTVVTVAREAGELVALVGEDLEDAVGLAQRRVGAVDDRAEVVAAGGEPGAEVVEDEAEAVAVGRAVDVVDQVEVDRLAVVLEGQQALALPWLAFGDLARARAAAADRAPRGCVGVQSTKLSPIRDCGRIDARGVLAEVLEAVVVDRDDDHGLARDRRAAVLER